VNDGALPRQSECRGGGASLASVGRILRLRRAALGNDGVCCFPVDFIFALRAGISTFDLSRHMRASLTMIDRHYGHLARDGREHAIRLLDQLSVGRRPTWTLVSVASTSARGHSQGQREQWLSRRNWKPL
jgi:hypothetical protein